MTIQLNATQCKFNRRNKTVDENHKYILINQTS